MGIFKGKENRILYFHIPMCIATLFTKPWYGNNLTVCHLFLITSFWSDNIVRKFWIIIFNVEYFIFIKHKDKKVMLWNRRKVLMEGEKIERKTRHIRPKSVLIHWFLLFLLYLQCPHVTLIPYLWPQNLTKLKYQSPSLLSLYKF